MPPLFPNHHLAGQESPSSYLPACQALLVGTPALLVAQSYIIIERMMDFIGKEYGPVRHNEITKVFFGLDMIAMALQVVGVSMLEDAVGKPHQAEVGKRILVAGLLLQAITFGIYIAWVIAFDFLLSRDLALRQYETQLRSLRMLWIAFYVGAVLITIRTIYRIVGKPTASERASQALRGSDRLRVWMISIRERRTELTRAL
ncbi:hypothetical protein FS837_000926 [Tulasnella sp. UAMH 9824]|nr:hypothetical protein FS837_000926 [Tulasnella sp. UAMH 9824]